jgi:alpha-glucosidase (family GH31 glycosyl hydrolase)
MSVYLPAGEWFDAWTGAPVRGGGLVTVETPFDRIPVFTRNRSLLELFAS